MPITTNSFEIEVNNEVYMAKSISFENLIHANFFVNEINFSNLTKLIDGTPQKNYLQIIFKSLVNDSLINIYKSWISSIRALIGDYPEVNKLMNKVFYSDSQYIELIQLTLQEFNMTPPLTAKLTIPEAYGKIDPIIIYGTLSHAYRRLSDVAGRNNVPWQGGEVTIDLDKSPYFEKWFNVFHSKYQFYLGEYKRQANWDAAWGSYEAETLTNWDYWWGY